MFKSLKRITYKVNEIEKARQWYSDILNTNPVYNTPFVSIFRVGDCSLALTKTDHALSEKSEQMEVYWEVDDIDAAFENLIQAGAHVKSPVNQVLNIRTAMVIDPFGNTVGLSSKAETKEKRTVEHQPSETAMSVTFCRALSSKDDREELKGPDYLAEIFLANELKKAFHNSNTKNWAIKAASPFYGYIISRTAFIDSIFTDACKEEIPQIVMLGAGYDTRPYRFIDKIKNTRIFELDINSTRQKKIEVLKREGIKIPGSLSFISINFKKDKINEVLDKAGYDSTKKTLFIWEGVTYYLPKESIDDTLRFISNHSPSESIICFDYIKEKAESINPSEPFLFWISNDKINEMLSSYGLLVTDNMGSIEMEKKYLTLKNGTLGEKTLQKFCFIKAVLKK